MINIIKQEIKMEESLKQRLEFICQFCKTKPLQDNKNTNNKNKPAIEKDDIER